MTTRDTTTKRGYGAAHKRERAKYERRMQHGETFLCARGCGTVLTHGDTWDLGHNTDRTGWTGPECVPCNRGAGARNSNETQRTARETFILDW